MRPLRAIGSLLWRTINRFFEDGCPGMAASLAFYTLFSLPPLTVLLFVFLGFVLDPQDVQQALGEQVRDLVGGAAAQQIEDVVVQLAAEETQAGRVTLIGAAALLFGATTAFAELQGALNRIWRVEPDPERGTILNFLTKRIFSFGIILALGFFLLVSLLASTFLALLGGRIADLMPGPWTEWILFLLDALVSLVVISLLFAAMFRMIPDARVEWSDVRVGAIVTAVLFVAGRYLIGAWLGGTDPGDAYGAAGSLAILLIWVYYSSMIVYFGAELTREWQDRFGSGVRPATGAVEVVHEKRKVQEG